MSCALPILAGLLHAVLLLLSLLSSMFDAVIVAKFVFIKSYLNLEDPTSDIVKKFEFNGYNFTFM